MAILPSVTWDAENAARRTGAVLKPAHCASVGLKPSAVATAWGWDGACGAENRLRCRM